MNRPRASGACRRGWVWLVLLAGMLGVGGAAGVEGKESLVISGSDTMVVLNRELAGEYAKLRSKPVLTIEGRGSNAGIADLIEGKADIAAASRPMKDAEVERFVKAHGVRPVEHIIAMDGVAVYVHINNSVSRLTVDQLARILSGEVRNWSEVGGANRPIAVYNRDKNSGTRVFVEDHVMGGRSFSPQAREVRTTALIAATVARHQGAIGYGGIAYAEGARIIRLSVTANDPGTWPSIDQVAAGKYPLSRPLYYYVNPGSDDAQIKAYIDWVFSPAGQEVVEFVGFFPRRLPAADASIHENSTGLSRDSAKLVTPESMESLGLSVRVATQAVDGHPDRVVVLLHFGVQGKTIDRVRSIVAQIGQDIEVPLALDEDRSCQITLGRSLVDKTVVMMSESDSGREGPRYRLPMAEFLKPTPETPSERQSEQNK